METESFIKLKWNESVIIAMKGLPCTGKTLVAGKICDWAKLPVLCIDDFIGAPHNNNNNNNNIADESWEEAEQLHVSVLEQAFTTLCKVVRRQLDTEFRCVVIKSRLSSPFELKHLIQLFDKRYDCKLLIVECQVRNKYLWQNSFNGRRYEKTWYRPRRWNDIIDKLARDDDFDPQSIAAADWGLHLQHRGSDPLVRRLVVDPYYDLDLPTASSINPIFAHAINHLLRASYPKLNNYHQNPYVVEFDEFRRSRAKEVLNALSSTRSSKHLCGVYGCLFKYKEELRVDDDDANCCGVCEQKLVSAGKPGGGYTCHYCILSLHKSCAEFNPRSIPIEYTNLQYHIGWELSKENQYTCNSHLQEFNGNCESCCFQTALKGRMVPAVVNHDHHSHPLSLRISGKNFICKACGVGGYSSGSYVCRICEWYYHIQCVFVAGEWKHAHGGHDHVLKRKDQEDYWCDVCFEDLDPYYWYYTCESCPHYAAHLYCVGFYSRELWFPSW